jgi:DNA repair exonuclease SbcCD ATPase subunit
MSGRKDFISDGLVHVRDRLKTYADEQNKLKSHPSESAVETEAKSQPEPQQSSNGKQLKKALQKRSDEFAKSRRDLTARLTENLAALEEEARQYDLFASESEKLQDTIKKLLDELEEIAQNSCDLEEDSAKLGETCRKVEHIRLEFIRQQARFSKLTGESGKGSAAQQQSSLLPDLQSLSIGQWFKIGFSIFMPIIIAILLGSLLIVLAIIVSMGGVG